MLLNATLPKIFQRKVLRWLPPELGQYVLDAGRPFSLAGEIALVRAVSLHAPFCMHVMGMQIMTTSCRAYWLRPLASYAV